MHRANRAVHVKHMWRMWLISENDEKKNKFVAVHSCSVHKETGMWNAGKFIGKFIYLK